MSEANDTITVVDLLNDVALENIEQTELAASRGDGKLGGDLPEAEPSYRLSIDGRDDDKAFRVGLRTEIQVGTGSIISEIRAEYLLGEMRFSAVEDATRLEFANKIAIMAILPYTRQSIADITSRVFGAPLLMPIVQRGELEFEVPTPTEDMAGDDARASQES
ncbi:hypothetical protein [Leifsonia sp. WHRI 6310E]|uniref:hypothetical protein n=1 Tax=Leifsonia sp. WHRI 6310E TaxID=3162562 RepID=UPI0032EBFE40